MKKFTTRALIVASIVTLMTACSKNNIIDDLNPSASSATSGARIAEDDQQAMRKEFGIALAKALKENKELRVLIKTKALEMIDEDYDVLFAFIRDERLTDKLTVKELIGKYLRNKNRLEQIENAIPTLTIFVPQLPNGSFSAQSWNTDTTVPKVGIKSIKTNDVPIVDAEGVEAVLPGKYAPGFPVVVVKNSLRIMESSHPEFAKSKSQNVMTASNGKSYRFISDRVDRKLRKKTEGARLIGASEVEDKIENAYDLFQGTDNWQRDHIYYNLTPTQPNGAFSVDFKEALTSFRMTETDPMGAYNLISDATDDPHIQTPPTNNNSQNAFWTSASYSFRVHVVYNSKNGLGTEFTTVFPVAAYNLWDVQYNDIPVPGFWPWQTDHVYVPTGVTPKTVSMREEVFNWDIANYATTVLVRFEEVDTQTNIEKTVTTADTYATNFGLDGITFGKIGLKFGGSATTNQTVATKISYQEGSDDLGQGSVNFADKILTDKYLVPLAGTIYEEREYTCGYCRFTMRPVKVQ
ncbi:hypothetical protein GCM10028818_61740 [Spirosoma horti]